MKAGMCNWILFANFNYRAEGFCCRRYGEILVSKSKTQSVHYFGRSFRL